MKKITKKQIALIIMMIICALLFLFFFVIGIIGLVNFFKNNGKISEPIIIRQIFVYLYFCLLFGLIIWLAVLSFKNNVLYSYKRRITLIVLVLTCAIFLIISIWHMTDNLIHQTIPALKELKQNYPNNPLITEIKKTISINICYQVILFIFYSFFLLLSIPFMRKLNDNSTATI